MKKIIISIILISIFLFGIVGTTFPVEAKSDVVKIGDVDWDSVSQKVNSITPVPGGVGSVTTAYILRNISLQLKKNIA